MRKDSAVLVLSAFLLVFGVLGRDSASAHMEGTEQEHAGMHHMTHTAGEEAVATIKTKPEHITAGVPTTIVLSLKDRRGRPITDLTVHHDRLIHVVIVSQDFSVFAHIHPQDFEPITPELKKIARYPIKFTFPKSGRYIMGIDFAVKGHPISKHFSLDVSGEPKMGHLEKDLGREKTFGDLDVELSAPGHIVAGKEVTLGYFFKTKGRPVTDLDPYLSAPMHLAIISADLAHFIHTHGEIPGMSPMGPHEHEMHMRVPERFGPRIDVYVVFPVKGLYQIFGQVGHRGKVVLTSFMVEVE
jgi:hypothetical protein